MSVDLHCEGCGKRLRASAECAGQRTRCPACGHEIYVPLPEGELTEFPLAREDERDLEREALLGRERLELDRDLAHESVGPDLVENAQGRPAMPSSSTRQTDVENQVIAFLEAMRDANLTQAEGIVDRLRDQRAEALIAVDKLIADQIPPPVVADVPPGVYQGFLKKLRTMLG